MRLPWAILKDIWARFKSTWHIGAWALEDGTAAYSNDGARESP